MRHWQPMKIDGALMFMLETRYPLELTPLAMAAPFRQSKPSQGWGGFQKRFPNND